MKTQSKKAFAVFASSLILLLASCGGGKKQASETTGPAVSPDVPVAGQPVIIDTNHLNAGVRYTEERNIDTANPPVVMDFTQKLTEQPFDLAHYFTKATCVTLKHPLPPKEGGFLCNATICIKYDQGANMGGGISTRIQVKEPYILTSDIFGTLLYDQTGNLIDSTGLTPIKKVRYNAKKQEVEFDHKNRVSLQTGLTLLDGEKCKYMEHDTTSDYYKMCWKSIPDGKILREIRFMEKPQITYLFDLDESALFSMNGDFKSPVMLTTFDPIHYDTLCIFHNYNQPTRKITGSYTRPEDTWLYNLDKKVYFRQPFNDTIFTLASANKLIPAYILQFGDKRTDIDRGLTGDKSQTYIAAKWLDTDKFILFTYSRNYDCPNTRNNKTVTYQYALYDKKEKQLFKLPADGIYPDEYLLPVPLTGGIPVVLEDVSYQDDKLVTSYTKRKLQEMQKLTSFSKLPADQKERIRNMEQSLDETEMIVMILE